MAVVLVFGADFAFALINWANFTIGRPIHELNVLLDLDGERNLPTWYSSIKLFAIAACLGLLAWIERSSKGSLLFAALALVFLGFSADEIIQAHEALGERLDDLLPGGDRRNTVFVETGIWMFILASRQSQLSRFCSGTVDRSCVWLLRRSPSVLSAWPSSRPAP
jgi:hypothetical protein